MTRTRQRTPRNFYPRPPRGGRRNATDVTIQMPNISTHALREEGDLHVIWLCLREFKFLPTPSARRATSTSSGCASGSSNFYPRPPRGGRRCDGVYYHAEGTFLPTPSARRATHNPVRDAKIPKHFYPRPPRGGRPYNWSVGVSDYLISTHALREEGDLRLQDVPELYAISTHALREEGDDS